MMTNPNKLRFIVPEQIATIPMPDWAKDAPANVQRAIALATLERMIMDYVEHGTPCEGVDVIIP